MCWSNVVTNMVLMSTVENRGAKLSNAGFSILVQRTAGDERIGSADRRADGDTTPFIPPIAGEGFPVCPCEISGHCIRSLSREIHEAVEVASSRIELAALTPSADRSRMSLDPKILHSASVNPTMIICGSLLLSGAFADVTSALATMADLPNAYVEKLMTGRRSDGLLALVRSRWPIMAHGQGDPRAARGQAYYSRDRDWLLSCML